MTGGSTALALQLALWVDIMPAQQKRKFVRAQLRPAVPRHEVHVPFEPQLPHHRAAYNRVSRHRVPLFGTFLLSGALLIFFAPVNYIEMLLAPLFIFFVILHIVLEARLFLIFRQDLLDRRRQSP